jgi:sugar phosphate isomerase/epimerase
MYLGYNTNGTAHHDVFDAVELMAEIGYEGVAITIDHGVLNETEDRFDEQLDRMKDLLAEHGLRSVVETGARFLLDSQAKHEPTFMSGAADARTERLAFLMQAIDVAARLGSDCVSLWSGILRDEADEPEAFRRLSGGLIGGLREVIQYAADRDVVIGFEPEPGMFIDTMARYEQLLEHVDAPNFKLTLDVGHLHCQGEQPIAKVIRQWADRIVNVHIEDMRRGVHEHLMFGEGEMAFPPIISALNKINYAGGVFVELSRHSHMAPEAMRQSYDFLHPLL